jgi:hypothetical protein
MPAARRCNMFERERGANERAALLCQGKLCVGSLRRRESDVRFRLTSAYFDVLHAFNLAHRLLLHKVHAIDDVVVVLPAQTTLVALRRHYVAFRTVSRPVSYSVVTCQQRARARTRHAHRDVCTRRRRSAQAARPAPTRRACRRSVCASPTRFSDRPAVMGHTRVASHTRAAHQTTTAQHTCNRTDRRRLARPPSPIVCAICANAMYLFVTHISVGANARPRTHVVDTGTML